MTKLTLNFARTGSAISLLALLSACGTSDKDERDDNGAGTGGTNGGDGDGDGDNGTGGETSDDNVAPTVLSTSPADGAENVVVNRRITVIFSEAMDADSVTTATFTLEGPGDELVSGTVSYSAAGAVFAPDEHLEPDTLYHVTITTGAEDEAGNALETAYTFSFTTSQDAAVAIGPEPVLLGLASDYVILAKSGIDTVPTSDITGNIGVSPIDSTAVTGFSLTVDAGETFSTSSQVTGQVRAPDYAAPTGSRLTTAVSAMETAYTDAAGRPTPDESELGAGEIGGLTIEPGLYKWGTGVMISTDVTLDGGPDDVWIFQISGDVTQASDTSVTLSGGALPKNIFWQTFGQVSIGTDAHFEGIVLCQTAIVVDTGASINGRLLAQTAVTLAQNVVKEPAD